MKVAEYYELLFDEILCALRRSTGLFLVRDHASLGTGRARFLFEGKQVLSLCVVPDGELYRAMRLLRADLQMNMDVSAVKAAGYVETAAILPNGRVSSFTTGWALEVEEMRDNTHAIRQTTDELRDVLGLPIKL